MKILTSLKRTLESIEASKKRVKEDAEDKFAAIKAKYADIAPEVLENLIKDVCEVCAPAPAEEAPVQEEVDDNAKDLVIQDENAVDVVPAEGKPVDEPHKTDATEQMNELDASEDGVTDETPEDFYTEDDEEDDDELVISEEDETEPEADNAKLENEAEEDEDFDVYEDELDLVEETGEKAENIDMTIPEKDNATDAADAVKSEGAEKIDLNVPTDDDAVNAADKGAKEIKNEDNSGAKAAMANKYNKGNFSSDVDALTAYLDEI